MSAPARDPDEVARALREWFEREHGFAGIDVTNVVIPSSTGFSNETILFDASWHDGDARVHEQYVARVAPSSYQVFPDDTFELQYRVMRDLSATAVPAATVHWYEHDHSWFGKPFWIMERVHGDIPTDNPPYAGAGWLAEASTDDQARAWTSGVEAMAMIHNLDVDALRGARDDLGLVSELERYERFLRWAEADEPHPLARDALAWLRANEPPAPAAGPALVWGDARLSNVVYREFDVVAVLDWEMATIGDPLLDLGWWLFADNTLTRGSGFARLAGFATRDETAALWSNATGRATHALDYYLVFAGLRFTVIMLRMGKLLAEMGLVPRTFAYDNLVSQALANELARV
jgi:aminoglycoside phosphotransferase (APT) family kinase protein